MILHGNHGGVRGISFAASFQAEFVVEFQWQAGNQDGMLQARKFPHAGFPQTGCPAAQRGYLHRQANSSDSGKKSRQLLCAALLVRDKRGFVKLSQVASPVLDCNVRFSRRL